MKKKSKYAQKVEARKRRARKLGLRDAPKPVLEAMVANGLTAKDLKGKSDG